MASATMHLSGHYYIISRVYYTCITKKPQLHTVTIHRVSVIEGNLYSRVYSIVNDHLNIRVQN